MCLRFDVGSLHFSCWHAYIDDSPSSRRPRIYALSKPIHRSIRNISNEWKMVKMVEMVNGVYVWPLDIVALAKCEPLWNAWNCLRFKPLSGVQVNTVNETDLWMPCIVLFIHSFLSVNSFGVCACMCLCVCAVCLCVLFSIEWLAIQGFICVGIINACSQFVYCIPFDLIQQNFSIAILKYRLV